MVRFWAVVALALVPAMGVSARVPANQGDKDVKIEGTLKEGDPKDKVTNTPSNIHKLKLKANTIYVIDMVSTELDAYLRLEDEAGKQLAEDDDGGNDLNARIVFECKKDGEYKIICTCYPEPRDGLKVTGKYTLTVRKGTKDDLRKQEALLDQPAPEGVVRIIRVGADKQSIASLHEEIKKLVAQK